MTKNFEQSMEPPPLAVRDDDRSGRLSSRAAIAEELLARRDVIERVIRRRLGNKLRAAADLEDVFSSVLRRVDMLYFNGTLRTQSTEEFWALVLVIARNVALNRARIAGRDQAEPGLVARADAGIQDEEASEEIASTIRKVYQFLPDDQARELYLLRLRGATNKEVASAMNVTEVVARQRWSRLCRGIRRQLCGPSGGT